MVTPVIEHRRRSPPGLCVHSGRARPAESAGVVQLPCFPAFGLVPWFAFLRRALIFLLSVRFDMGRDDTGRALFAANAPRHRSESGSGCGHVTA